MSRHQLLLDLLESVASSQNLNADEIEQLAISQGIHTPQVATLIAGIRTQARAALEIADELQNRRGLKYGQRRPVIGEWASSEDLSANDH